LTAGDRYWQTAHQVCTPKELAALNLVRAGLGEWQAALRLGISRRSLRDRVTNAERKILAAHQQETAA
jgi:DNA-binding CsgD family transcriptional regulator